MKEGIEPPFEQEFGLVFLGRQRADDVFIEARRQAVGLDVGDETGGVLALDQCVDRLFCHFNNSKLSPAQRPPTPGSEFRATKRTGYAKHANTASKTRSR